MLGSDQNSAAASVVYLNDGEGNFTTEAHALAPGFFGESATLASNLVAFDINGDGQKDLVMAQTANDPHDEGRALQVSINDGGGVFSDATAVRMLDQAGTGRWIQFIEAADLDEDGAADIVLSCDDPGETDALILRNDGHGTFAPLPCG